MFEQLKKNYNDTSTEVSKALVEVSTAANELIKENEKLTKKLKSLKKLKLYEFHCKGHYLGSNTIVRADSLKNARECIQAVLTNAGLGDAFEPDRVYELKGISGVGGTIIAFDDGDY